MQLAIAGQSLPELGLTAVTPTNDGTNVSLQFTNTGSQPVSVEVAVYTYSAFNGGNPANGVDLSSETLVSDGLRRRRSYLDTQQRGG